MLKMWQLYAASNIIKMLATTHRQDVSFTQRKIAYRQVHQADNRTTETASTLISAEMI